MRLRNGLGAAGLVLALFGGAQVPAQTADERTTAEDVRQWEEQARASGSIYAALQVGLAYDLGLGVEEDKAEAFRWYLSAAEAGDPDGQFNVAVMLDSGLGVPSRDLEAAFRWYTRAAANGQPRAQYNLGLVYSAGDGVPRNLDLARVWYGRAAERLPAAADKLRRMPETDPAERRFDAPRDPYGALVEIAGGRFAEMVWTAGPGPGEARFLVEIMLRSEGGGWTKLHAEATDASGLTVDLISPGAAHAWRVSRIIPGTERYASSRWQRLGEGAGPLPPDGPPAVE